MIREFIGRLRNSIQCATGHDWYYEWEGMTKECWECGEERDVDKTVHHGDPEAEIGDERYSVTRKRGNYRIVRERYNCGGHGPDDVYFDWSTSEIMCRLDRERLVHIRDEINDQLDEE